MDEKERQRLEAMLIHERSLWERGLLHICGVDEAGRGPLAGPVAAAAVIFPQDCLIPGINDSKKLSAKKRESLFEEITEKAMAVGVGIVSEKEIDKINILQASFKAMRMAIGRLKIQPDHLLIDGHGLPEKFYPQTAIVGGDRKSCSIAAASIIAKVTRDRMMIDFDAKYPEYGFAKHKGYGTKQHIEAIHRHGPCEIHRRSFRVTNWGGPK